VELRWSELGITGGGGGNGERGGEDRKKGGGRKGSAEPLCPEGCQPRWCPIVPQGHQRGWHPSVHCGVARLPRVHPRAPP
jgi:hypothetical protein